MLEGHRSIPRSPDLARPNSAKCFVFLSEGFQPTSELDFGAGERREAGEGRTATVFFFVPWGYAVVRVVVGISPDDSAGIARALMGSMFPRTLSARTDDAGVSRPTSRMRSSGQLGRRQAWETRTPRAFVASL